MTAGCSRRHALAAFLGAFPGVACPAADGLPPLRIAISETMIEDVNLNDARAAMQTWIKRLQSDLGVAIEMDPKVFSTTDDIVRRIRAGQLDSAALNVVEYQPIANLFDPTGLLVGTGASGPDQYVVLVKRAAEFKSLSNLRGRRLNVLKSPKMCVAPAWLATLLGEEQLGPADGFFGSMVSDAKVSRVVLPVFFDQAEACLTSRRGFETMCELNPQVGRTLAAIASSPVLVTCFYAFRKNYQSPTRERFIDSHRTLLASVAGRQIATLFQFDELRVADASCLDGGLRILEKAERIAAKPLAGSRVSKL